MVVMGSTEKPFDKSKGQKGQARVDGDCHTVDFGSTDRKFNSMTPAGSAIST